MKQRNQKHLSVAVRTALLLAALPFTVQAQVAEPTKTLDSVQVSGSRIKRSEIEGQVPVQTITREAIERSGLTSIGDIL